MASSSNLATWSQQLAQVRAAITAIETHGQAYNMDGGALQLTRANLTDLYARERELERKVARAARGGGMRTATILPAC